MPVQPDRSRLIRLIILEYITLMRDFVFPDIISEDFSRKTGQFYLFEYNITSQSSKAIIINFCGHFFLEI